MTKKKPKITAEYSSYGGEVWFGGPGCGSWTLVVDGVTFYCGGRGHNGGEKKHVSRVVAKVIRAVNGYACLLKEVKGLRAVIKKTDSD